MDSVALGRCTEPAYSGPVQVGNGGAETTGPGQSGQVPAGPRATEPVPAGVAHAARRQADRAGPRWRRRRRRRPVARRAAGRPRRRRRRGRARPPRPRPTGGGAPRPRRSRRLSDPRGGSPPGLRRPPGSSPGRGRARIAVSGVAVSANGVNGWGPTSTSRSAGSTAGLAGQGRGPGRPPVAEELAVAEAHPQVRPGRLVGIDPGDRQDRHVRVAVEPQRHLLAFAECHDDPPAVGSVRSEPAGELVPDAVGRDPARVALADDGRGDGQGRHRDQGDRRDARRAGGRGRRPPLAQARDKPRPAGTDRDRGQDGETREVARIQPEARGVQGSRRQPDRRDQEKARSEARGAEGTPGDDAPAGDRDREQERGRAVDPERDVDVARLDDRQRVEREELAGRGPDHDPPPGGGQDRGTDEDRRQPSQTCRRDRPDQRHRQDEQRQGRLLDQDREAEQQTTDRPAPNRRSPDGEQGRDDRGRLWQVDAERRDQAPDECRRDQRERGPDRPARPGQEPAQSKRAGQREQAEPERHQPRAHQRVAADERAAGREREAIDRRAQQEGRAARRDRSVPVEDRQPDVQVAGVVGCQRRPATEGDPEHGEDHERRRRGRGRASGRRPARAGPGLAGGPRDRPSGAPCQHVPDRPPGHGESARGKDPPGDDQHDEDRQPVDAQGVGPRQEDDQQSAGHEIDRRRDAVAR